MPASTASRIASAAHAGVGAGLGDRVAHGVEHRQVEVARAALARRHAADHPRAIRQRLFGVKCALPAGESLADDFGISVYQNRHQATSLTA
jgi:hypothetical protein